MDKKYCPILTIGFDPPKNEKTNDSRLCHPDCAWFSEIDETCSIKVISDNIDLLRAYLEFGGIPQDL